MTYDLRGGDTTGIHAPLFGSGDTADSAVQYWAPKAGSNVKKLCLGIPLYGRRWTLTSSETGVGAPGTRNGEITYSEICQNIKNRAWTRVFDTNQKVPFAFGEGQWVGYDDAQSIDEKITYAQNKGLGGVFVWETAQDDASKLLEIDLNN